MSDGITAATRESDLAKQEIRLACELLRCLKDPDRPTDTLFAIAEKADSILVPHGGGRTSHATTIIGRLQKLRDGDETYWARRLLQHKGSSRRWVNDVDDRRAVVDLYSSFKELSPFKNAVLLFGSPESPEIAGAITAEINAQRYSRSEDEFLFVLTGIQPVTVRAVWVQRINFSLTCTRAGTGPWVAPE